MFKDIFYYFIGVVCIAAQTDWHGNGWHSSGWHNTLTGGRFNYTGNPYNKPAVGRPWNATSNGGQYNQLGNVNGTNTATVFGLNHYNRTGYNPYTSDQNAGRGPWLSSNWNGTNQSGTRNFAFPGGTSGRTVYKRQTSSGFGSNDGNIYSGFRQGGSSNADPGFRPAIGLRNNNGNGNNPYSDGRDVSRGSWLNSYWNRTNQGSGRNFAFPAGVYRRRGSNAANTESGFRQGTGRSFASSGGAGSRTVYRRQAASGFGTNAGNTFSGFQQGNIQSGNIGPYGFRNATGSSDRFGNNQGNRNFTFHRPSYPANFGQGSSNTFGNRNYTSNSGSYGANAGGQLLGAPGSWYNPTRGSSNPTNYAAGYNSTANVGYTGSQGNRWPGQGTWQGNRTNSTAFGGSYGNSQGGFRPSNASYGQANPIIY